MYQYLKTLIFRFFTIVSFLWIITCDPRGSVLYPIKSGQDVGLIFAAGLNMSYEQYQSLGQEIQEFFPFQLWVYLSDNDIRDPVEDNILEINNTLIYYAKTKLVEAGLPENAPLFVSGHNQGAELTVYRELEQYPELALGLVMIGVTLQDVAAYPTPLMTINGDLDGNARVTKMADEFRYIKEEVDQGNTELIYNFPHVLVEGMNHAQFVTGDVPAWIQQLWISPEITDDASRYLISEALSTFILYYSTEDESIKSQAEGRLTDYYDYMDISSQPIFNAWDLEYNINEESSPWSLQGYEIIADLELQYEQRVQFENLVTLNYSEFSTVQPEVTPLDDNTIVTESYTHIANNASNLLNLYLSADMLEIKYKSKQAIMEELTGEGQDFTPTKICKDINEEAWPKVWSDIIPDLQKDRYTSMSINVTFLDDMNIPSGPLWLETELLFDYNGETLAIQSPTLVTRNNGIPEPYNGMHYCKLLSPARVLEFVYVDSLYEDYYDK